MKKPNLTIPTLALAIVFVMLASVCCWAADYRPQRQRTYVEAPTVVVTAAPAVTVPLLFWPVAVAAEIAAVAIEIPAEILLTPVPIPQTYYYPPAPPQTYYVPPEAYTPPPAPYYPPPQQPTYYEPPQAQYQPAPLEDTSSWTEPVQ